MRSAIKTSVASSWHFFSIYEVYLCSLMFSANQFARQFNVYYSNSAESHHFFLIYVAISFYLLCLKPINMSASNMH